MCTLLTFVTGRRVALAAQHDRFDPNAYGANACLSIETLEATALAWQHRQEIVNKGFVYALLLHNEALGFAMLQVAARIRELIPALNVLVDRHPGKKSVLSEECRKALKTAVSAAVDECEGLEPPQRDGFKALFGSKIDQGLGSSLS